MHERIGAERQKQKNYAATARYRGEIETLRRENTMLKKQLSQVSGSHNDRLAAR